MTPEFPNPDARRAASGVLRAAALGLLPLLLAAGLTAVISRLDGASFAHVRLFPPHPLSTGRFALAAAALLACYFGVFFAPGLLLMRALALRLTNSVANAVAAFVLSLLAVSLGWILAQAFTEGVAGRVCLYLTVASVDVAALVAAVALSPGASALPRLPAEGRGRGRAELLVPVGGILFMLAASWFLMPGKISIEALEGDATEVHGFAASLVYSALPEWDLESGVWGFYPTFMFIAYPVFFSIGMLGDSEAAVRLPALLMLGMLVLVTADLAARGRTRAAAGSLNVLLPMLAVGYLSLQVGAYYAGYHPFHGDLGCSPLEEWLATALAVCALLLLRDGAPGLAAISALLAVLSFPSGLMFAGLVGVVGLLGGTFEERKIVWRWGLALAALFLAYAVILVIYTVNTGTFGAMIGEWYAKYFEGRASFSSETPARAWAAVAWFTLLCGGLPVLGLFATAFDHDRVSRWMALVAVAWTAFFVLSPNKNIHYFMPAALLPMAVSLRIIAGANLKTRWLNLLPGGLLASTVVCIALCAPRSVPPYVADREFGERTVFLARSERQAVDYSKVLYNVTDPLWRWRPGKPWSVGHHTWVMYASRRYDFDRPYDFYVGAGPAPVPDVTEITHIVTPDGERVTLWVRGGRATLRDWKNREYPHRNELSRFNFDMAPAATAPGP